MEAKRTCRRHRGIDVRDPDQTYALRDVGTTNGLIVHLTSRSLIQRLYLSTT